MECDRNQISDVLVGNDDTTGVFSCITNHTFDHAALIDDGACDGVAVDLGGEFGRFFDGIVERDIELVGDHLGQLIRLRKVEVVDSCKVTDDHLSAKGPEGDNIGYAVFTVFIAYVVNHLVAAAHAEIHVEVRRGDAF